MLCPVLKWFLFPSPCQKYKGIFLHIHRENLVEMQEVKLHKNVGAPQGLGPPPCSFYLLELLMWNLQQSLSHSPGSLPTWAPPDVAALVSCDSAYPPACRSLQFGGNGLPCDLTSLSNLERGVELSVCSVFTCC